MYFKEVRTSTAKPLQVIKLASGYHGVVLCEDKGAVLVSECGYHSPLVAANAARKHAKEEGIQPALSVTIKPSAKVVKSPKLASKSRLLTEDEMAHYDKLRFREVWVLVDKDGRYVRDSLNKEKGILATYTEDRDKAQVFRTYEQAALTIQTFKAVYLGPHQVRRFFIDTLNE